MNEKAISQDEIKQLFIFMNRIKSFEKTFIIQKDSMTKLIWGLFLMSAGILHFVLTEMVLISDTSGIITLLPWGIAILSGFIIQIFSDRHLMNIYSWEKPPSKIDKDTIILFFGFIFMGMIISFLSNPGLHHLSFPSVAIISGLLVSIMDKKYFQNNKNILQQNLYFFTPLICIISAIVMIFLFIIDETFINLHSIIFGVAFGGSFSLIAFLNHRQVEKYIEKMDSGSSS